MKKQPAIFWAVVAIMGMFSLYCAIRADMDKPVKPEIEVETVTTNVQAMIITWTKTIDGRQFQWGIASYSSNTYLLVPLTK